MIMVMSAHGVHEAIQKEQCAAACPCCDLCHRLADFTELMNREASNLVASLRPAALDFSAVDVNPLVQQHMTVVLGLTAFGCVSAACRHPS